MRDLVNLGLLAGRDDSLAVDDGLLSLSLFLCLLQGKFIDSYVLARFEEGEEIM